MTPHPQRAAVLEAYKVGEKYVVISTITGVGDCSIRRWIRKAGLELRGASQPRLSYADIIRLHAQGLTDPEIAQAVRGSPTGVRYVRRKLGLRANLRQRQLPYDEIARLHGLGMCDFRIAKIIRRSDNGVRYARRKLGLPTLKPKPRRKQAA